MPSSNFIEKHQTNHQGKTLASQVLETRRKSIILASAGKVSWDADSGTFAWESDLHLWHPTLASKVVVAAGSIAGVNNGESVYLTIPYLTTDDYPGTPSALWSVASDYTATVSKGSNLDSSETLFVLGVFGNDGRFYLCTGQVLGDGDRTELGSFVRDVDQQVTVVTDGNTSAYSVFPYAAGQRQISVYVNGVLQMPAQSSGVEADGYMALADAHYQETQGAGTSELFQQITFQTGFYPATGEVILIRSNPGARGATGPASITDLNEAYVEGETVTLVNNEDGSEAVQTPVELVEDLLTSAFTTGDPLHPDNLESDVENLALVTKRSAVHAAAGTIASMLSSGGDFGGMGVWLANANDYATLESILKADGGLFYLGVGQGLGAGETADKLVISPVDVASLLVGAGEKKPGLLSARKQGSNPFQIGISGLTVRGQTTINGKGELSAGTRQDHLRWLIFELDLPAFGPPGVTTVSPFLSIPNTVVEDAALFLGAVVSAPYISGANTVYVCHHSNPSVTAIADNTKELKVSLIKLSGGGWQLDVTYGSDLGGQMARCALFFSTEYTGMT